MNPQETQYKFYKQQTNGEDYYQIVPWAGNIPYGMTPLSQEEYLAGKKQQIEANPTRWNPYYQSFADTESKALAGAGTGLQMINGVPTSTKSINDTASNETAVLAGTMKKVPVGSGFGYVPTGSSADKLSAGVASGAVSPTDPNAQNKVANTGNNTGAPGITPVAPPAPTQGNTPVGGSVPVASPVAPALPTVQQGSVGAPVIQLQQALGIEADGKFGPQTLASVKAYQLSHGLKVDGIVGPQTWASLNRPQGDTGATVLAGMTKAPDDPSNQFNTKTGLPNPNFKAPNAGQPKIEGTTIPSTGNPAIDALIKTLENQSPQKSFSDVYKEVYNSFGLSDMKANYEAQTKAFSDLQEKKNEERLAINNNPWLSEGVRVQKLRQLDSKYEGRELILTNKLKLGETAIDNARSDAQFIAGQTMDQLQQSNRLTQDIILKAIDIAEREATAERTLNKPIEVSAGATLYTADGKKIVTAPKSYAPGSTTKISLADNITNFTKFLKTGTDGAGVKFGAPQGTDGFVDPDVYITAFKNWPGTPNEFITKFPVKTYVNPLSYNQLPASIQPEKPKGSTDIDPATGLPNWMIGK